MFSSNFRNKRLQYYDWCTKHFVQPVKKELRIYDKIWKIATDQNYDNATGCLIDYNYLKKLLQHASYRFMRTTNNRYPKAIKQQCFSLLKNRKKLF